jgi:hypothetical protein
MCILGSGIGTHAAGPIVGSLAVLDDEALKGSDHV